MKEKIRESQIDICIAAYNAEKFLEPCLDSIEKQAFRGWRLIVVDDGSVDKTETIVKGFASKVAQTVLYKRHQFNCGLPRTRNTGLELASSPFVAFLDADDYWDPHHLVGLLDRQNQTGADVVFSASRVFDSDTGLTNTIRNCPDGAVDDVLENLLHDGLVIQPSSVMLSKEVFNTIGGFDAKFKICNDLDFWLKAAGAGFHFAGVANATCHYRKHEAAMSNDAANLIAESAAVKLKYLQHPRIDRNSLRVLVRRQYWNAARIARATSVLASLKFAVKSMTLR